MARSSAMLFVAIRRIARQAGDIRWSDTKARKAENSWASEGPKHDVMGIVCCVARSRRCSHSQRIVFHLCSSRLRHTHQEHLRRSATATRTCCRITSIPSTIALIEPVNPRLLSRVRIGWFDNAPFLSGSARNRVCAELESHNRYRPPQPSVRNPHIVPATGWDSPQ